MQEGEQDVRPEVRGASHEEAQICNSHSDAQHRRGRKRPADQDTPHQQVNNGNDYRGAGAANDRPECKNKFRRTHTQQSGVFRIDCYPLSLHEQWQMTAGIKSVLQLLQTFAGTASGCAALN
jgi:hypothetical protein